MTDLSHVFKLAINLTLSVALPLSATCTWGYGQLSPILQYPAAKYLERRRRDQNVTLNINLHIARTSIIPEEIKARLQLLPIQSSYEYSLLLYTVYPFSTIAYGRYCKSAVCLSGDIFNDISVIGYQYHFECKMEKGLSLFITNSCNTSWHHEGETSSGISCHWQQYYSTSYHNCKLGMN